jgi:hypothetical protein
MFRPTLRSLAVLGFAITGFALLSVAEPVITPPGLSPGALYRLAFVTSDTHDALSNDISVYNAFVTAQASQDTTLNALNLTWQAIASTASVDAYQNIGASFTVPIYNLAGQLVASGSASLWSGNDLANPIDVNQFGDTVPGYIWTGTLPDGSGLTSHELGSAFPVFAFAGAVNGNWIENGFGEETGDASDSAAGILGISPVLVAGNELAAPEPGTVGLMMLGGISFAVVLALKK